MSFTYAQTKQIYNKAVKNGIKTWLEYTVSFHENYSENLVAYIDNNNLQIVNTKNNLIELVYSSHYIYNLKPVLNLDNLTPWLKTAVKSNFIAEMIVENATTLYFSDPQKLCDLICENMIDNIIINLETITEQIKIQMKISKQAKEQIREGVQKDKECEVRLQELYVGQRKLETNKN